MRKLNIIIGLLVMAVSLTGCGSDSSSSQFTPRSYSGTLSGTSSGTFKYTVNDNYGNITGTATLAGKAISLKGSEYPNNIVVIDFNDTTYYGTMTGTKSNTGSDGTWYLYGGPTNFSGTFSGTLGSASSHSLEGKTMYAKAVSGSRFAEWTFYPGGSGIYTKPLTGSPAQTNAPFNWTYDDNTGRFVITNSHGTDTGTSIITLHWDSNASGYADEAGYGTLFTFTLN